MLGRPIQRSSAASRSSRSQTPPARRPLSTRRKLQLPALRRFLLCLPLCTLLYLFWLAGRGTGLPMVEDDPPLDLHEPATSDDVAYFLEQWHNIPASERAPQQKHHAAPGADTTLNFRVPLPSIPVDEIDTLCLEGRTNCTSFAVPLPYMTKWHAESRLVVLAIMATGDPERVVMRRAQRLTWGGYEGVANKANKFHGSVLPLALHALTWRRAPYVPDTVRQEMDEYEDTLLFKILTARKTHKHAAGQGGMYGQAFQYMNSRKLLLYYRYVYHHFPSTPFVAKTDDDTFVYIPELLRMVVQLPRVSTAYGCLGANHRNRKSVWGHFNVFTRDVAMEVAGDEPAVVALTASPYRRCNEHWHLQFRFDAEDDVHTHVLPTLYGPKGLAGRRPMPSLPLPSDGIPPVQGWGAAYMELQAFPLTAPRHVSGAQTLDGSYNVTFRVENRPFAWPTAQSVASGEGEMNDAGASVEAPFRPSNILILSDNCRVLSKRHGPKNGLGVVAQHRVLTVEDHLRLMDTLAEMEEEKTIRRPTEVVIRPDDQFDFEYIARLDSACESGAVLKANFNWPQEPRSQLRILKDIFVDEYRKAFPPPPDDSIE